MKTRMNARIAAGARWLGGFAPQSLEERAMQILGLHWAGQPNSQIETFARAFNPLFLKSSGLDFEVLWIPPPISEAAVGLRSAVVRLPCHGQNMKVHGISKTPEPGSGFKGVTNEANTLNAHTALEACIVIV